MVKIEKYTGEKTYMYPDGSLASPENVRATYSAVTHFTHIVETDEAGQVLFSLENLAAVKSLYGLDLSISDEEAITAIEDIRNTPQESTTTSAEERIAAALEFQNLLSM